MSEQIITQRKMSYVWIYMFAFCALGALLPLIGQYLSFIGFSGTQIGTITSAGTATAIFASTFWGKLYNKRKNKKSFVCKLIIAAALVCVFLSFIENYFLFLMVFCVLYFFQAPSMALIDAITIEDRQSFGAARKWGSIGFAIGVFITGQIAELFGLTMIFWIYIVSFTVVALIIFVMSRAKSDKPIIHDEAAEKVTEKSSAVFYKNKKYILLVISAFFLYGTIVANNTYFGFLFIEGGGTLAGIGVAFLLMAGSEAPFMAWAGKLSERFTTEKLLLVAFCLSALRFAWYATCPPAGLLLGFFVLQGMTTGIIIVEFVKYVAKIVKEDELGFAISVYYALGTGVSGIFYLMLSGVILDHYDIGMVYAFFACMNLLGVVVYVAGRLHKSSRVIK